MKQHKLCPDCRMEYLPHIEKCADCGSSLLLPEAYREAQEKKKQLEAKAVENRVVVREGDLGWLSELRAVLIDGGIACSIHSAASCGKGCSGDTCQLVVSPDDLERARGRIEEYFMEINPEIRVSNELIREGKCPACASPVGTDDRECPDCDLPLLIVEEEDE